MIIDSSSPPLPRHANSTEIVTDLHHLDSLLADGRTPSWLRKAAERVAAGYVHSVFAAPFVACFWRVGNRTLLRATSRHVDFALTMEAPVPPTEATLNFLFRHAKTIFNDVCPFPPAGAKAHTGNHT